MKCNSCYRLERGKWVVSSISHIVEFMVSRLSFLPQFPLLSNEYQCIVTHMLGLWTLQHLVTTSQSQWVVESCAILHRFRAWYNYIVSQNLARHLSIRQVRVPIAETMGAIVTSSLNARCTHLPLPPCVPSSWCFSFPSGTSPKSSATGQLPPKFWPESPWVRRPWDVQGRPWRTRTRHLFTKRRRTRCWSWEAIRILQVQYRRLDLRRGKRAERWTGRQEPGNKASWRRGVGPYTPETYVFQSRNRKREQLDWLCKISRDCWWKETICYWMQ